MRWRTQAGRSPAEFLSEKTFLVIKNNLDALSDSQSNVYATKKRETILPRSKSKSAIASAGTWPPKLMKSQTLESSASLVALERPKTANLDRPSVLDPRLIDKLDMSMVSKEYLCDSLTRLRRRRGGVSRLEIESGTEVRKVGAERRRQKHHARLYCGEYRAGNRSSGEPSNSGISSLTRQKRKSFEPLTDSETYHQRDTSPEQSTMKKQVVSPNFGLNEAITRRFRTDSPRRRSDANNNNNNNSSSNSNGNGNCNDNSNGIATDNLTPKMSALSVVRRKASKTSVKSVAEVFTGPTKSAPEPCKTCGRSDQPERFHSHPKPISMPIKIRNKLLPTDTDKINAAVPKSIQKPVALNFRSEKRCNGKMVPSSTTPRNQEPKSRQETSQQICSGRSPTASAKKGPRTVTCYICSREFGTASFPIHEPKCLQKWERENNLLPPSQRRSAPQRPVVDIGHQEWNTVAWEQSQAQLLPCSRCGRTFLPHRLPVHEKSCKSPAKMKDVKTENAAAERPGSIASSGIPTPRESPMVFCQICGRTFGSKGIKIHEPQCRKRWEAENEDISTGQRKMGPASAIPSSNSPTELPQKKTVPCYICGREFGSMSIVIHEPQCIKKWHQENNKLPLAQQRRPPQKPDIVFTRDESGNTVIDQAATAEANWRSHLGQLVPCKRCGRTFNPDRVAIHERSCKGTR